jgi:hypothetical protein
VTGQNAKVGAPAQASLLIIPSAVDHPSGSGLTLVGGRRDDQALIGHQPGSALTVGPLVKPGSPANRLRVERSDRVHWDGSGWRRCRQARLAYDLRAARPG